jgi:hypothetical protein
MAVTGPDKLLPTLVLSRYKLLAADAAITDHIPQLSVGEIKEAYLTVLHKGLLVQTAGA